MTKIFGLFRFSADYYEWRDLKCCSISTEKLAEFYRENFGWDEPLKSKEESEKIQKNRSEITHYFIEEIPQV